MSRSPINSTNSKRTKETLPSTTGSERHPSKRQQRTKQWPKYQLPPQNLNQRNVLASPESDGYGYRSFEEEDIEGENIEEWKLHTDSKSSEADMLPASQQNRAQSPNVGDDNNDLEEGFDSGDMLIQPESREA